MENRQIDLFPVSGFLFPVFHFLPSCSRLSDKKLNRRLNWACVFVEPVSFAAAPFEARHTEGHAQVTAAAVAAQDTHA